MDSSQLTVPAKFVSTMLETAAEHRCDTDALLDHVGIDRKELEQGKPLPVLLYGELHHHIIELVQDEWFGMLSGGPVPKGVIRLLCQSIVHCKTLKHALIRSAQFFEVCRGFKIKPSYEVDGDYIIAKTVKLDYIEQAEFDELIGHTDPQVIKSTLSAWHGFYSWLVGKYIPLNDVYYNFPADEQQSKVRASSKAKYHYNESFCGQRFHKKYLNYPIVQNEESIEDFMRKAPYYVLIKRAPHEELTPHVKALLVKSIGEDFPKAADVAEYFNMSVTTLHRHLGGEGTSFQTLKNESRMEAAIHYLNCPDISTSAISDLLSFENPSTFYRSFKKWTGLPPGEYRKQLLAKDRSKF
jgi:AraC-like DNA-binding protein